jgi:hypothetical protein
MNSYETGRSLLIRLTKGSDLLEELTEKVKEKNIKTGTLQVIGAVTSGCLGYYDQIKQEYRYRKFEEHLEIASCIGNISILNNTPMVHAHIVFSDEQGNTFGGHLAKGTLIFAGEAFIQELNGPVLTRNYDEPTGLNLWHN